MEKKLSEEELKQMWNAEMAIETRCEWCLRLKEKFCKKFKVDVDIKANRFCAFYSPE